MNIFKQIRLLLELAEKQQTQSDHFNQLLCQNADELQALRESVSRHDIVLEDMLDEWQSFQDQQQEEKDSLRKDLLDRLQSESKSLVENEQALLSLSMNFLDQLFVLRRAAVEEKDPSPWARQVLLTAEKLQPSLMETGLQLIDSANDPFSYQLHESVQVISTDDPALDMRVKDVLSCGYLYQGRVVRKARVAVWRLSQPDHTGNSIA